MTTQHRTVHLVSVGVSLFDNLQRGRQELIDGLGIDRALAKRIRAAEKELRDPESEGFPAEESAKQAAWLREVTAPGSGTERQRLEKLLKEIEPENWPARASAELTALAVHRSGSGIPPADTVVLLASDTGRGLRAALFNAAALAGGDLKRVRYLHDPSDEIAAMRGDIVIARLPGLDVGNDEGFTEAMRGLGDIGRGVDRLLRPGDTEAALHLSGGFKAALPFLLGLGEALRSLRGPTKVKAYAVHELDPDQRAVELPLRHLPATLLEKQLADAGDNGYFRKAPPDDQPLDGFAYEQDDDGVNWRLTPFGHALRRLFPRKTRPEA
ncbi:hypothetical protein [Nocardiopsis potens]|uniref:hypothetical protein n=1 Tax=Nocardiopsis potens TaxID=1246458 RepID=UPI00034AA734|nr:hypothetical protein [Nocardiopsis potens]